MFVSNHQESGRTGRLSHEQPLKSPANPDSRVAQAEGKAHTNTPSRPGAQAPHPHNNERLAQEERTRLQRPGAKDRRTAPSGARFNVMLSNLDTEASTQRRPALKVTAHTASPTAQAGQTRLDKPSAASGERAVAQAASKPAKTSPKPASATGKNAAKTAAKAPVKASAKVAVKAAAKTAPAKPALEKAALKEAAKPVKAAAKTPAKPAVKAKDAPAKPSAEPVAQSPAQAPVKTAVKAAPKPAAAKLAEVKAAVPLAVPLPQEPLAAPQPIVRKTRGRSGANALPAPAPVVPTHAPDAAKASYMLAHERAVAPPPPVVVIRKDPKLANNWKNKPPEQLSDEEVIAMPDTEYMNDVQLAFFRLKLTKLKQDIHNNAGETTEHLREDTVVVPDPADRATIEEEHALELRTRDRERKLLKKIEQSIHRIDSGDYGFCDETGEAIGVGRLIARPTASLSLEAQQRRELRQKMFGD
jgi:DnaK suppressor protein